MCSDVVPEISYYMVRFYMLRLRDFVDWINGGLTFPPMDETNGIDDFSIE